MVIKIYVSGISGNKEVKKRQQRVLLILDSKKLKYEAIDIAEPGAEEAKDFMQNNATGNGATISDQNPRHPLPPQLFNDDVYCGDYNMFDLANEEDRMEEFLKLQPNASINDNILTNENKLNNGELLAEKMPLEPEKTESVANEVKDNEVANEPDSKIEEDVSSKVDDENVETEKTKEDENEDDKKVGDAAEENGKEEEQQQESTREPSPEKAEE